MSRINRTGKVTFHDASVHVWEDPDKVDREYSKQFKRDVFKRIVQQLNRLGWTVSPWDEAEHYKAIANDYRSCGKGDLKGELRLSGRCIEFNMWQGVNTPTRPDHGGRYEHDKEGCMPYLIRLEMERTRRKIRDYLCNVFDGYAFKTDRHDGRMQKVGPKHLTAMEWLEGCYKTSWHFKGDLSKYKIDDYNRKSADGQLLNHGQRVWFFDWKGRIATGIAYYNINNMWWVITGKYGHANKGSCELFTALPENIRVKRNVRLRRQRLESELSKAIKTMNFERASLLRKIIFPEGDLYVVWHTGHKAYHGPGFSGYTTNIIDAGKFTADEVSGWSKDPNEVRRLEAA